MCGSDLLHTTITVGTDGVSASGFNQGLYGSIATATFKDHGGTTRTIVVLIWDTSNNVSLFLSGGSIPNNNTTFISISLRGPGGTLTLSRAAATYNGAASGGTLSSWIWSLAGQPGSSGQSVAAVVT
jgi:hypothetical protein